MPRATTPTRGANKSAYARGKPTSSLEMESEREVAQRREKVKMSEWNLAEVRHCLRGNCPVHISYQTFGQEGDPAVLLVMGLNNQGLSWDEALCREIALRGFFVVRFDNREIGLSTKFDHMKCPGIWRCLLPRWTQPKGPYDGIDMVDDAVALLDFLNIGKAHWVGISMGSVLSQLAALHRRHKVLSLTLCASSSQNHSLPEPPAWVKMWFFNAPKGPSFEERVRYKLDLLKTIIYCNVSTYDEEKARERVEIAQQRSSYDGSQRQIMATYNLPDRQDDLKSLGDMSVAIIHGMEDVLIPPMHGVHLASCIPNSELFLLHDCGHAFTGPQFNQIASIIEATARK